MSQSLPSDAHDPLLSRVLGSSTIEERESAIEEVLSAEGFWRIDRILDAKFRRSSIPTHYRDDIRGDILLRLINRLHRLHDAEPLQSFTGYVSTVAYNTFDDFLRRAFPLRTKLKNRIRYALEHDARFAVWTLHGTLICGLEPWQGKPAIVAGELDVDPGADLRAALHELFTRVKAPLELEAVVALFAVVHVPDESPRTIEVDTAQPQRSPTEDLENLQTLRMLWDEICTLPLKQRIALLLSARDAGGESITRFLPVTGVATVNQIGRMLSLDTSAFDDLWHDLPLEDTRIAVILEVTRQQVINLRRSARERLARRMRSGR